MCVQGSSRGQVRERKKFAWLSAVMCIRVLSFAFAPVRVTEARTCAPAYTVLWLTELANE